jgi:hypothetical protein
VVRNIREHWDGIVAYLETRLTNGPAEAVNGLNQTIKRKARGFGTFECFPVIYLVASKLSFDHLPIPVPPTHYFRKIRQIVRQTVLNDQGIL